jgi:hypothetical protein
MPTLPEAGTEGRRVSACFSCLSTSTHLGINRTENRVKAPSLENRDRRPHIFTLVREQPTKRKEPAMTVIEIPDDQAAKLKAKAAGGARPWP